MGTKLKPGPSDCYAKAEPDEPMFVLLARDRHAPALVWLWSVLRNIEGEREEVVNEACQLVGDMMMWAAAHGRKSAGVGQAVLAGVVEMIRAVNHSVKGDAKKGPTTIADFRRFLCATQVEPEPSEAEPTPATADAARIENGAELIAQERRRQLFGKHYDPAHDDEHTDNSLLIAGILIACDVAGHELKDVDPPDLNGPWPDALLLHVREKHADDETRQLVIAGAMIAAEIDRRNRLKTKEKDRG